MASEERVELPLRKWLDRVNARALWTQGVKGIGDITAYAVNGHTILVQRFIDGGGWAIYLPASKSNSTVIELDSAAMFCGVEGCRGLV